jgi:small-conductance mechanosensitive channel
MQTVNSWLNYFSTINLTHWISGGLLLIVGILASRLTRSVMLGALGKKLHHNKAKVWSQILSYFILALFITSALSEMGFELKVLLGAAGIFTVAIGFAAQTSTSNLISGLFLMLEKPFSIGDVLEIEGTRGEVIAIGWLSITLRMFDNTAVRIPNEMIIKQKLLNATHHPIRRIDIPVGIAYKEKIDPVKTLLLDIVDKHPRCLAQPEPKVWVMTFGASSVDLQLSVFVRREIYMDTKSEIIQEIKKRFDEENIEIPFPHQSIYTGSDTAPFPIKLIN